MEGFTSNFHAHDPSFSFIDNIDQSMDSQFDNIQHMSSQNYMGFSNDNFFLPRPILPSLDHPFMQSFDTIFQHEQKNVLMIPDLGSPDFLVQGKRKSMDLSSSTSGNSSSRPVTELSEKNEKKHLQSSRKGKKVKVSDSSDTSKEVIHVRARRGQATDSHSIAERVRRGKIKERLICLQDIVPGCSKSMGMAVMLDEIINYVQSLQNQVEFLSMKLTEASNFPNYDSDLTLLDTFQMGNLIEGMKMQRLEDREERGQVDQSSGSYPLLPYHTT